MIAQHNSTVSKETTFIKVSDFAVWNAAHQVEIIDSGTGKSKLVPFTGVWLKSPQARRFVHARAVQQHACHRNR